MRYEELKEILSREDEEFQRLADEHKSYDEELKELSRRRYLTPQEQLREVELKKMKLARKDRMMEIAAQYQRTHAH